MAGAKIEGAIEGALEPAVGGKFNQAIDPVLSGQLDIVDCGFVHAADIADGSGYGRPTDTARTQAEAPEPLEPLVRVPAQLLDFSFVRSER